MAELEDAAAPAHRVSVDMGFTKNLGNFESLKVTIGLAIDGKPGETPTQTFNRAADWTEKRLVERFQQVAKEFE